MFDAVPLENRTTCQKRRGFAYPGLRRSSGFTLMELLIVVALIGVIAAVGIPIYQGYIVKSKITAVLHAHENMVAEMGAAMARCSIEGGDLKLYKDSRGGNTETVDVPCSSTTSEISTKFHYHFLGYKNPYALHKQVNFTRGGNCKASEIDLGAHQFSWGRTASGESITICSNIGDEDGNDKIVKAHVYRG